MNENGPRPVWQYTPPKDFRMALVNGITRDQLAAYLRKYRKTAEYPSHFALDYAIYMGYPVK